MIPFNEAVLRTFENAPDENAQGKKETFFYPLKTHKQARAFARAIQRHGLPFEQLCKELNETVDNFKLWESKKGAPLVGTRLMDKVNSYIETVFVRTGDKYCKSLKLEESVKLKEGNEIQNDDKICKENAYHVVSEPKCEVAEIKIEVSIQHLNNKEAPPSSKPVAKKISSKNSNETKRFVEKFCDLNFVPSQKSLMSNSDVDQLNFVNSASIQKVGFSKSQATKNISKIQVLIDKFNRLSRKEASNSKGFVNRDLYVLKGSSSQLEKKSFVDKLSLHHYSSNKGENVSSPVSNVDGCKVIHNQGEDYKNKEMFVSSERVDSSFKHVKRAFSNHNAKSAIQDLKLQPRISTLSFNKEISSRKIHPESTAKVKNLFNCLDKKDMTTSGDKPLPNVSSHFIAGQANNNSYKIAQNKESKENTNFQIKANLGLKFGISVASIISKFNKLQERK